MNKNMMEMLDHNAKSIPTKGEMHHMHIEPIRDGDGKETGAGAVVAHHTKDHTEVARHEFKAHEHDAMAAHIKGHLGLGKTEPEDKPQAETGEEEAGESAAGAAY